MGEVLQGPWGERPAPGSAPDAGDRGTAGAGPDPAAAGAPPRTDLVRRLRDPASPGGAGEPAEWAVPGVDRDPVDADEPVPLPGRTARRAENVSMAVLTGHDASAAEVRARLVRRGLEPDDVDAELARLQRAGLVDDRALAERLIERLRDRKGLGDGALRAALRQRQIAPDIADAAIAGAGESDEAVHDRLQQVADDRARRLGGLPPEVAERRLLAYLQRKGWSGSEARDAARTALGRA